MTKHLARLVRCHDLAIGPILVLLGIVGVGFAVAVPLIEAVVLRLIGWDDRFSRCVRDAFAANLASTCAGLAFADALIEAIGVGGIGAIVAFVAMCAGSMLVEGAVLFALDRERKRPVLLAAVLTNLVSYALLVPLWFFL